MRLTVKNLGVISKASVDLSKDLIILTGENNTGKTYLAYVVYGFHNLRTANLNLFPDEIIYFTHHHDSKKINVEDYFSEVGVNSLYTFDTLLKDELSEIFSVHPDFFENTEISFDDFNDDIEFEAEYVDIKTNQRETYRELDRIFRKAVFKNTFIIPSERQGIELFHKELALIKNKTFDTLLQNGGKDRLINFLKTRFNMYPSPIRDSLALAQTLDAVEKQKSQFERLGEVFERDFLQGEVFITDDGDIRYKPNSTSQSLEIHMTSSTVKSLASLSIYLNHLAQKGDFIIIDEPEANLHPNNQLKIARFLARLVNEGFKVMISTHSDYIMRELNTLIMLGCGSKKEPETTKSLMQRYHYGENELLRKEQVGVYLFRIGKDVEEVKIEEDGFEVATIYETVDKLNESSQNIYFELFE